MQEAGYIGGQKNNTASWQHDIWQLTLGLSAKVQEVGEDPCEIIYPSWMEATLEFWPVAAKLEYISHIDKQ